MRLSSAYWNPGGRGGGTSDPTHLLCPTCQPRHWTSWCSTILLGCFCCSFLLFVLDGSGDKRVVKDGVYSTSINFDKSNVALHLRESGGWKKKGKEMNAAQPPSPSLPPSSPQTLDSLIMMEQKNLKKAGKKFSACLQPDVTVVYI